jgi:hypothetical protein
MAARADPRADPSPALRAIRNNPAPATPVPMAPATRSPAGARRSTVMAAANEDIRRKEDSVVDEVQVLQRRRRPLPLRIGFGVLSHCPNQFTLRPVRPSPVEHRTDHVRPESLRLGSAELNP